MYCTVHYPKGAVANLLVNNVVTAADSERRIGLRSRVRREMGYGAVCNAWDYCGADQEGRGEVKQ